jgi:hypothetical protein
VPGWTRATHLSDDWIGTRHAEPAAGQLARGRRSARAGPQASVPGAAVTLPGVLAPVRGQQVGVLGVALDVAGHERALEDDLQATSAHIGERAAGEPAADAHPLGVGQDLGVDEGDRAGVVVQLVLGDADDAVAEPGLVAGLLGVVLDDEIGGGCGRLRHRGIVGRQGGPRVAISTLASGIAASSLGRACPGWGTVAVQSAMEIARMATGTGTKADPWLLKTAPGTSEYSMYRDDAADPPQIVCMVGSTKLTYDARAIDELHAMLAAHGGWMDLGGADEQKPAPDGSVEAWGRSVSNPRGGWYGLKKRYRGRFGVYLPPLLEALGLVELTHDAKNNRVRAK